MKHKVWGSRDLSPWYPAPGEKIGEVWFEADLPLLVKFIFTSDRLSVQVHPGDEFAAKHENSRGKTEMWHVLRADPGAQIALGFREAVTADQFEKTALSGEILELLNWVDVHPGDTFFIPAGRIHAIGAGVGMCEIQQHSDITYRIFDYGRPRELHLEKAMQVCYMGAQVAGPVTLPVECAHFHTEAQHLDDDTEFHPDSARFELLVFHEGDGAIAGHRYQQGEAWLVPAGSQRFEIEPARNTKLLRTWVP